MLRATTLWALLGAAAVTVGQAQPQFERQLGGEQYCEEEIEWDRARCEASSACCSWNEGDAECVSHIGNDACSLPDATVEASRLNGEQYCEQYIQDDGRERCEDSSVCCSWNEDQGRCWSDIGNAECPLDDAVVFDFEERYDYEECDEECEEAVAAIMGVLAVLMVVSIAACIGILVGINCCINNKKQQYPGARVRGGAWLGCLLLFIFDLWCFMWIPFCVSRARMSVPAQWHHSERFKHKPTTTTHPSVYRCETSLC